MQEIEYLYAGIATIAGLHLTLTILMTLMGQEGLLTNFAVILGLLGLLYLIPPFEFVYLRHLNDSEILLFMAGWYFTVFTVAHGIDFYRASLRPGLWLSVCSTFLLESIICLGAFASLLLLDPSGELTHVAIVPVLVFLLAPVLLLTRKVKGKRPFDLWLATSGNHQKKESDVDRVE
jgi:hypothetical protein